MAFVIVPLWMAAATFLFVPAAAEKVTMAGLRLSNRFPVLPLWYPRLFLWFFFLTLSISLLIVL
ncbi:hypothetical protein [Streptomyces alkaliphilus]|uniref:hypothetical protein n=1 Tax=Streptomyces alkaliphilus TaxID=1472722 RepID=UPI00117C5D04|nr:hypothetical protein [Streptomyces alkaliphilus]MQS09365.1 hypothetical protein [Streptomyces alkaliphilus]